jgi:hypothetical protein
VRERREEGALLLVEQERLGEDHADGADHLDAGVERERGHPAQRVGAALERGGDEVARAGGVARAEHRAPLAGGDRQRELRPERQGGQAAGHLLGRPPRGGDHERVPRLVDGDGAPARARQRRAARGDGRRHLRAREGRRERGGGRVEAGEAVRDAPLGGRERLGAPPRLLRSFAG